MPPLIHKFFSIPENFRKTERFLYKAFRFGPVRQKFLTKPWCPLLRMKNSDKRIFLKHQSVLVLQLNISVQWDKNFDGKSWYSLPYPNFFDTRNYCNSKGFPYGNFRHCETKNFRREILILPPPLIQTFSVPEISETLKGSPTKFFGTVRQKIFDGKSWYPLPLSDA